MNSITIVGNLTRDPEVKFLQSGTAAIKFSVAVSRKTQNGQEETSFVNVVGYGSLAENAHNTLHKGNRVIVSGRLDQRSWETEKGEKKTIFELTAQAIGAELRFHTADIQNGQSGGSSAPKPAPAVEDIW